MIIAVYSAPGKALLAGGYLVLFPEYSAFSVGLSSRMHAAAETTNASNDSLTICSPQFDSQWIFPSGSGTHPNPFLSACYKTVCAYFGQPVIGKITVWSDDGFHSQSESRAGPNQRFRYHYKPITDVPKTGLGSSAALVAAVVPAMVALITTAQGKPELTESQLHNLAQIAHCHAQQKIGSGFDVATAIFGSIVYSRFSCEEVPADLDTEPLRKAVNKQWKMVAKPCNLPSSVVVVMGDVSQGSETPGMVKRVLKWSNEEPEISKTLFTALNEANMQLASTLQANPTNLTAISSAITMVRAQLQQLTKLSGVPIEPPKQTALLDKAGEIDSVLGGVVPGAGGDDAVCLLVDTATVPLETTLSELQHLEGVHWMPLDLESQGLKSEPTDKY